MAREAGESRSDSRSASASGNGSRSGEFGFGSRSGGHLAAGRFGLTAHNRTKIAAAAALLVLALAVVLARGLPEAPVPIAPWISGTAAAALFGTGLLLALRKRNLLGLRKRGAYATWAGAHAIGAVAALAILLLHSSARRGGAVPLALAALAIAIAASGIFGASLWHRRVRSPWLREARKHWLQVHVGLLGPFLVALALHVLQVLYF